MAWKYFIDLLRGIFWNTHNLILSLPAQVGALISFVLLLSPKLGSKIKNNLEKLRKHAFTIFIVFILISTFLSSYSLYKNKKTEFATPDELISPLLQNMNIRISDLVREDNIIRNKVFDNCHIYGPAIIYNNSSTFDNATKFTQVGNLRENNLEGCFVETTNKFVIGAIELNACAIKNCTFHRISIIGTSEQIRQLKKQSTIIKQD